MIPGQLRLRDVLSGYDIRSPACGVTEDRGGFRIGSELPDSFRGEGGVSLQNQESGYHRHVGGDDIEWELHA